MRISRMLGLAGMALLTALAGCGGGGGSSSQAVTSISGQAMVPTSQSDRAPAERASRANDPLVPLPGATVTVHDLTTGQDVTSAVTDSTGHFLVSNLTPGHNYVVRITKTVGAGTLIIKAVVTCTQGTNDKDITPATTVAAAAVEVKLQGHPELKDGNLGAVASDLEEQAKNSPPPALTDSSAVSNAANSLITVTLPSGSYTGSYSGGNSHGTLCADFADGKFLLVSYHQDAKGGYDGVQWATGTVDSAGTLTGVTSDGRITLKGAFSTEAGAGVWTNTSESTSGTWTLKKAKEPYAGLYSGVWLSATGGQSGMFAVSILDDRTALVFDLGATNTLDFGVGTLTAENHLAVQLSSYVPGAQVTPSVSITGHYNPTDGTVGGEFTTHDNLTGTWSGSRARITVVDNDGPPPPPQ